jgi:hypothetical protein
MRDLPAGEALDLALTFPADAVGVVVDTYRVWWDAQLATDLDRARARHGRLRSSGPGNGSELVVLDTALFPELSMPRSRIENTS